MSSLYQGKYPEQALSCKQSVHVFTENGVDYGLCPYCFQPHPFEMVKGEKHLEAHHLMPQLAEGLLVPACLDCHQGVMRVRAYRLNLHHPAVWDEQRTRNAWWSIPFILLAYKASKLYSQLYRSLS